MNNVRRNYVEYNAFERIIITIVKKYRRTKKKVLRFWKNEGWKIKFALVALAVVSLCIFIGIKGANIYNSSHMRDYGREKIFIRYYVHSNDTLWEIAEDMIKINPEYPSVRAYVSEVASINHTDPDKIKYGEYIIIPTFQYSEEQKAKIEKKYDFELVQLNWSK